VHRRCTESNSAVFVARGSVFKKDGRWAFRVDVGVAAESGRRRQLLRQGFTTKRAAEDALEETLLAARGGSLSGKSKLSLGEYSTTG
jgi:hypothetical protein